MEQNTFNCAIELHWALIIILLSAFIYQYILKTWWFFNGKNIKFYRGMPLLGSLYKSIICLDNEAEWSQKIYQQFPNEQLIGIYDMLGKTSYMNCDPELIKQITITDFDHFINHRFDFGEDCDPMLGRSLFALRDEKWRRMRAKMSPAFTGSKMRLMHSLIVETTNEFINTLITHVRNNVKTYNARDIIRRYACDIIGSCAFGININSMKTPDNEFFKAGRCLEFEGWQALKFFGFISFPSIMKFFKCKIFPEDSTNFFRNVISNNIKQREQNRITRNDMIDLLIKAKNGKLAISAEDEIENKLSSAAMVIESNNDDDVSVEKISNWSEDDLVAQAVIFFLAGFDTVSVAISFLIHELAVNPDVQSKLYEEITATKKELNGKDLDYATLSKMKYIDMVVSESLRRWIPAPMSERSATKAYELKRKDGTSIHLKRGDGIWIPSYAIQLDAKFFSNPRKFDPERFNDENKQKIKQGTYMPFGMGPRGCIASRFSIMEIKTIIFYLLCNFEIQRSEKTIDPIELKHTAAGLRAKNGLWIDLKLRSESQNK